jgi:hypothetical protein
VETLKSSIIGGYQYWHVNNVNTGLIGTIFVSGVPTPWGQLWPYLLHNAPPPGKAVVYITGPELVFDASQAGPK